MVVTPDTGVMSELLPQLADSLPGIKVVPVQGYPDLSRLSEAAADATPVLCFLDVESDGGRALAVLAEVLKLNPNALVVILLARNDPDLILRYLRQGATEFITRPFGNGDLKPVLDRLSALLPAGSSVRGARVICVVPAKGACGASMIASNLAYQRKRIGSGKMLLADLDPFTGVIAFLLKAKSNYSFLDALTLAATLDEDLWRGIVTSREGLDILPAPENAIQTIQDLPNPAPLIDFARQHYETIIVDTAGVVGPWGLSLAAASDELLLVTTNELPALQATQRTLAYLERNEVDRSKVRLVVNRFSRDVGLSKESISTALHIDVFHVLVSDYESVHAALIEGRAISGGSTLGKNVGQLADRLSGRDVEIQKTRSSWGGLFASLFSKATL